MIDKIKFTKERKILWIDDDINKPALEPDRDELEGRNCTIKKMIDPDDFINKIEKSNERNDSNSIDCILIDTMLPNGSLSSKETNNTTRTGLILIKKLNESGKYQNVPVIVYSVVDEDEIKEFCSERNIPLAGVTILSKSIKSKEFADRVVKIVESEQFQTHKDEEHGKTQS